MTDKNFKLVGEIEAKLLQAQSMAKIALNNHNYKSAGYDEPFIEHTDMGNLLRAIIDLSDIAYNQLQNIGTNGGNHHG
ncbi:hypothetical protein [uncultured Gilliamella sp.]|jgi:hypothetical protein|uniref:hypothetical protein n=1 Tax=uncultured Gilliamella sp. TaxID=1193505 RepID=UPI002600C46E|nr:hypothetical protein [uncultured Gilliamella sp.]